MKKDLLKISDLTRHEIDEIFERSRILKGNHKRGMPYKPLIGKTLGLIFEKASTRTRVSFEAAMYQLGGNTIFISSRDSQMGRGEPIKDTARVLSRYLDAVVIRTFGHDIVDEFARYSEIPVINGLTDLHHPCQVLTDMFTIIEKKGDYKGLKIAWIGDGNNMANSWIEAASILGFNLFLACPKGYEPDKKILEHAQKEAKSEIKVLKDPKDAADGADVLNTDVWASMGQEDEREKRLKDFKGYQINKDVLKLAKKDAIVMHCLPAHRGEEITDEVMEGSQSVVFDQAENRLHVQKAVLEILLINPIEK
ncbi:MAG: ornithine carbamoyltransferase [Deltaproteobacteria bacterium GWC2_42_11]|nr:MAG: ornithine carbamoyltransferase [Deltaproteobacteria bacterium GWC2_42_11]